MEIEGNRGLIHKKAYEDQYTYFWLVQFWSSLIILSLSYSWILRAFLEHSWRVWHTLILEQEVKGRVGKCKRKSRLAVKVGFSCRYQVACMFSSLVLACMTYACGLLVMIYHWHGG